MKPLIVLAAIAATLLLPAQAIACATCFGAEGDPQTEGLNAAILTLLATTYTLFTGIITAGFVLWRRSHRLAEAIPPVESESARG